MKILIVVPYSLPDYSGSGINAFNFARFLNSAGHQASLLTLNRNMRYPSRERQEGVPIRRIRYYNRNTLTKLFSLILILPAYAFAVYHHRLVYIYGGHVIAYQALIWFSRLFGRKVVFQSLLLGEDDAAALLERSPAGCRFILRGLFRRLHCYHAINPEFAGIFNERIDGHAARILLHIQGTDTRIYHPCSPAERNKLRTKHGLGPDELVLLSVGFVIRRKGFEEVMEALRDWEVPFRCIVLGEYDFSGQHFLRHSQAEADEIMAKGKRLLGGKIRFMGASPDVPEFMQMSDIVIVSGTREGMPNVLLEALACGCTVLVRNIPGIRDFLIRHGENGIIYQDVAELRNWIRELHSNGSAYRHLGRNARTDMERYGTFSAVWERLSETLKLKDA